MAGTLRAVAAEFVGAFALVFAGAGAVCVDALTGGRLGVSGIALAHGLMLTAAICAFGRVSGGHFNPAVTVGALAARRLDAIRAVLFIAAQLLGAALAGILLGAAFHGHPELSEQAPHLGACALQGIGYKAATLLEAVATFFLASAVLAAADPRAAAGLGPVAAGAAYAAAVLAIGPLTGAALNPARAFGPAVASGYWENSFVYWIGPIAGGVLAAWTQERLFLEAKK